MVKIDIIKARYISGGGANETSNKKDIYANRWYIKYYLC